MDDDYPTEIHRRAARQVPPPVVSPPGTVAPARDAESQMTMVERVLDEQHTLNTAASKRVDRFLNRRRAGGQPEPARPRALRDVAAERAARREAEELRHARHQRRMDIHEEIRAVLGWLCILAVFVIMVMVGVFAFKIGMGDYVWGPIPRD